MGEARRLPLRLQVRANLAGSCICTAASCSTASARTRHASVPGASQGSVAPRCGAPSQPDCADDWATHKVRGMYSGDWALAHLVSRPPLVVRGFEVRRYVVQRRACGRGRGIDAVLHPSRTSLSCSLQVLLPLALGSCRCTISLDVGLSCTHQGHLGSHNVPKTRTLHLHAKRSVTPPACPCPDPARAACLAAIPAA